MCVAVIITVLLPCPACVAVRCVRGAPADDSRDRQGCAEADGAGLGADTQPDIPDAGGRAEVRLLLCVMYRLTVGLMFTMMQPSLSGCSTLGAWGKECQDSFALCRKTACLQGFFADKPAVEEPAVETWHQGRLCSRPESAAPACVC